MLTTNSQPKQLREHAPLTKQRGVVMVFVAIAMAALLGMVGMALDSGHLLLSKTRLQNIVDASALSGARTLKDSGSTDLARTEAINTFEANIATQGHLEIQRAYQAGELDLQIEFSDTLNPFTPGGTSPPFIRVRAEDLDLNIFLVHIVGVDEKSTRASAVAGPSVGLDERVCGILPILACGDPNATPDSTTGEYWGYNSDDPDATDAYELDGVDDDNLEMIKIGSGTDSEVGPGNFYTLRLEYYDENGELQQDSGGADLRDALADGIPGCSTSGGDVSTEPGNSVGPVAQGLNTRFGDTNGPDVGGDEDLINHEGDTLVFNDDTGEIEYQNNGNNSLYDYADYDTDTGECINGNSPTAGASGCNTGGTAYRRVLPLPIGDCSEVVNGQGQVPVLGVGCFFLLQEVSQKGNEAHVFGQFVKECNALGNTPIADPQDPTLPTKIVLYRDADSGDS